MPEVETVGLDASGEVMALVDRIAAELAQIAPLVLLLAGVLLAVYVGYRFVRRMLYGSVGGSGGSVLGSVGSQNARPPGPSD